MRFTDHIEKITVQTTIIIWYDCDTLLINKFVFLNLLTKVIKMKESITQLKDFCFYNYF